jgi:hypothetical protein
MQKLLLLFGMLVIGLAHAASDDDMAASFRNDTTYAELYGSCTRQTCPPGSEVIVTAKKGDSGIATTTDGQYYDLLVLRKIRLVVVSNDPQYLSLVNVEAPGGTVYSIQRMFLKRK